MSLFCVWLNPIQCLQFVKMTMSAITQDLVKLHYYPRISQSINTNKLLVMTIFSFKL